MKNLLASAAVVAILAAGGAHAAPNLLVNGDFETGDFTGWTVYDPSGETFVTPAFDSGAYTPESGTYFAALGAVGADGTLSQTFVDTPGVTYESSFWLASDGDTPNDITVTGPGSLVLGPLTDFGAQPYTFYFGTFTGSGLDTITFTERNDPGFFSLDNVSVTAAVPEPAAWASMILGLGLAGVALRRPQGDRRSLIAALDQRKGPPAGGPFLWPVAETTGDRRPGVPKHVGSDRADRGRGCAGAVRHP